MNKIKDFNIGWYLKKISLALIDCVEDLGDVLSDDIPF